ncbi:MaoC/PaaZ C-terminal domain-containing protein [Sphingobium aromaticiconvertens]|uniref:MaoC/PaaZ C-terminal domain-containing protein n=1 Tax=Sphingobium aromaticiconvertens TaxID=365341 RepID=UPI00301596EE
MAVLDIDRLRAYQLPEYRESYDRRSTILYALGVGAGLSEDVDELDFLYERDLKALPTMALVLGTPGFWAMDPKAGLDWPKILHGEETLALHRPIEPEGELVGNSWIEDIADKGPGKPVMIRSRRTLSTLSGLLVAEMTELWVLRGAGGFGGPRDLPGDPLPTVPDRPADCLIELPTARNQALLYRLSGDRNPLHADPELAKSVGFDGPILHGLSTMGVIGRALTHKCADGDPHQLRSMRQRFTAPVVPGDVIATEIWDEGDGSARFRASVPARGVVVADSGVATFASY